MPPTRYLRWDSGCPEPSDCLALFGQIHLDLHGCNPSGEVINVSLGQVLGQNGHHLTGPRANALGIMSKTQFESQA